jgi:GTP-binding protein
MSQTNFPLVAIIGRPNVGKSTLYNRLVGKRVAIESAEPGTTRDRLVSEVSWRGKKFMLVDTAGLVQPKDEIVKSSVKAAQLAIETADLILFLVDFKTGLTDADFEIAKALRKSKKEIILVVNKCDNKFDDELKNQFRRLGFEDIVLASAISGKNSGDLMDKISSLIPKTVVTAKEKDEEIKLAIIGRPNVGKSTLLNAISGEQKMIVSPTPHTTRDAQDFLIKHKGKKIRIIDTAGMRRRGKIDHDTVESFAYLRSERAIKDSKIIVYMIDTGQGLANLDLNLIGDAIKIGKSVILIVNKSDLWGEEFEIQMRKMIGLLQNELNFAPWLPVIFISAQEKTHLNNLLNQVVKINEERNSSVDNKTLQEIFEQAREQHLNIHYFKSLKFEKANPPVFKLKTHKNKKPHFSDLRYMENKIRDVYPYFGTPIFIDWEY